MNVPLAAGINAALIDEPGAVLAFDKDVLPRLPAAYRHLAYLQLQGGAHIVDNIPAPNSPEQQVL